MSLDENSAFSEPTDLRSALTKLLTLALQQNKIFNPLSLTAQAEVCAIGPVLALNTTWADRPERITANVWTNDG
jgi:hypothetical protein